MNTNLLKDKKFNKYYTKHCKCLKLSGFQPKTVDAYARAIRRIGNYFAGNIYSLTSDQLLDFFHELLETHSWSAVKLDLYGLKFFYTEVLKKPWVDIPLVKQPRTQRIPDIVTKEEANKVFSTTRIISYKVFFFTLYSLGLRLSEGIALRVGDIDGLHKRVHIRDSKGNKDRLVPLPEKTLQVLRKFWVLHKHPFFLFPSRKRGLKNAHLVDCPLDRSGIQAALKSVVANLKFKKKYPAIRSATATPLIS